MQNKTTFIFALISVGLIHVYLFGSIKVKHISHRDTPMEKKTLKLTRVVIQTSPTIEEIVQPQLPENSVVEPLLMKPIDKVAKKRVVKKRKVKKKLVKKKKTVKHKSRKIVKKSNKVKKTKISSSKVKAVKRAYLSKIKKIIEQRKRYPKSAKRLKQEGRVIVSFKILANGTITNISLAKKSSFKKLDKAGISILKRIGRFSPIPKELGKNSLIITIPIKYQII